MLDGEPIALEADFQWPLPALPSNIGSPALEAVPSRPAQRDERYRIFLTDRVLEPADHEVALRPPSLVVGVGASKGAPVDEVLGLVQDALRDAGLSAKSVAEFATVDAKAGEPGIVGAAERLGVPVVTYGAEELAGVEVPNPSEAPLAAVGTPSVAEAAALAGGGELLVPKRKSVRADGQPAMATCAVVRRVARGGSRWSGSGPAPVIC